MKRHVALHGLSEDHHHGLVLARRCASAAGDSSAAAATADLEELRRVFAHELEPHFRCEEELILPHLDRAGRAELVGRAQADHAELRRLVRVETDDPRDTLARFAELLTSHIRFEERELFDATQELLTVQELKDLSHRRPKLADRTEEEAQ